MPAVPSVPGASPYGGRKKKDKLKKTALDLKPYTGLVKEKKPRFGAKSQTDSGTKDRTISRYNRLRAKGINPGLSQAELDTGAGARKVKRLLRDSRVKYKTGPYRGRT